MQRQTKRKKPAVTGHLKNVSVVVRGNCRKGDRLEVLLTEGNLLANGSGGGGGKKERIKGKEKKDKGEGGKGKTGTGSVFSFGGEASIML